LVKVKDDRLFNVLGICLLLLAAAAVAWFLFYPRVSVMGVRLSPMSISSFSDIHLGDGSTPASVDATVRAAGFELLTNVDFNDLIPVANRSPQFDGATIYRYVTGDSNDERVLALPAAGTNCYLYVNLSGDTNAVQQNWWAATQLADKLRGSP